MSSDRANKPHAQPPKQGFEWRVTIRANQVDFMTTSNEVSAGCNCNCACDCSAISPLPPSSRRPRHRRVEGR